MAIRHLASFLLSKLIWFLFISQAFVLGCSPESLGLVFSSKTQNLGDEGKLSDSETKNIYCNQFNKNGFEGSLITFYDWTKNKFVKNKVWVHFSGVPKDFDNYKTNYLQFYYFNVKDGKVKFNDVPVTIDIILNSQLEKKAVVDAIGRDLLMDYGGNSIEVFISKHSFILTDTLGWQGVGLFLFSGENRSIKKVQVLIPPFEANPEIYLFQNNNELLLFHLHPFAKVSASQPDERVYYQKAFHMCKGSPEPLPLPPLQEDDLSLEDILTKDFY